MQLTKDNKSAMIPVSKLNFCIEVLALVIPLIIAWLLLLWLLFVILIFLLIVTVLIWVQLIALLFWFAVFVMLSFGHLLIVFSQSAIRHYNWCIYIDGYKAKYTYYKDIKCCLIWRFFIFIKLNAYFRNFLYQIDSE